MSAALSIADVEDALKRVLASRNESPWLDTEGAATYISCTPGTLKAWRARGEGPAYHLIHGKSVRYHTDDLDAFVRGETAR